MLIHQPSRFNPGCLSSQQNFRCYWPVPVFLDIPQSGCVFQPQIPLGISSIRQPWVLLGCKSLSPAGLNPGCSWALLSLNPALHGVPLLPKTLSQFLWGGFSLFYHSLGLFTGRFSHEKDEKQHERLQQSLGKSGIPSSFCHTHSFPPYPPHPNKYSPILCPWVLVLRVRFSLGANYRGFRESFPFSLFYCLLLPIDHNLCLVTHQGNRARLPK